MRKILALIAALACAPASAQIVVTANMLTTDTNVLVTGGQLGAANQAQLNATLAGAYSIPEPTANQISVTAGTSGGIGTWMFALAPPFIVNANATTTGLPAAPTGNAFQYMGVDSANTTWDLDCFGGSCRYLGRVWGGTLASQTAVGAAVVGNGIAQRSFDGTSMPTVDEASFQTITTQIQTATHHGHGCQITTTANNTTSSHTAVTCNASGGIALNDSSGSAPTGGDPGAGGLNAAGAIQVNGVAVASTASPTFTGTPAAPTAAANTNTTQIATTAFVQAALPSATGKFVKTTIVNAGTTTYTPGATTNTIHFRLQGPGAGGGGVGSNAAGNGDTAGGGGAGGYCEKTVAVTPNTGYTTSLPSGSAGGANTGANGATPSGDATISINGTTYTALKGLPGTFIATGVTAGFALGGAATAVSTNCDINSAGAPGEWGYILAAGAAGIGGAGGSSPFGAGGSVRKSTGAGSNGAGFGPGGSGALSGASGAGQTGGNGGDSILVVDEYQ